MQVGPGDLIALSMSASLQPLLGATLGSLCYMWGTGQGRMQIVQTQPQGFRALSRAYVP